tara:strand:+ start:259 stop:900 length:642 start_codon:yes stop_codon:yes gene_type:complete
MNSPKFNDAIKFIWEAEGGYQNDSVDTGNFLNGVNVGTNMGITAKTLASFLGRNVTASEMRNLSKDTAEEIYYKNYWKPSKAEKMPAVLSAIYFDSAVNNGLGGAAKILQRAINSISSNSNKIAVDGGVGTQTLNAIKKLNANKLHNAFKAAWKKYYSDLIARKSQYEKYRNGWFNRVDKHKEKDAAGSSNYLKFVIPVLIVTAVFLFVKFKK